MAKSESGIAVGIDVGTTYCCIATRQHGNIIAIRNRYGDVTTPSYIAFDTEDDLMDIQYGKAAKEEVRDGSAKVIFDIKRIIGRRFDDPVTQEEMKKVPYKVVNCQNHPRVRVEMGGKVNDYLPEQLSGFLLNHLKQLAETYLGTKVNDAVITVPANFNDAQKKATRTAGILAGFNVLQLVNEPTAAAIAYGKHLTGSQNVLVFDFGGGTLDVSVLVVKDGKNFTVKATAGDMHLGGEDIDQRMAKHCAGIFQKAHGVDITQAPADMKRVRHACEKAKIVLSNQLIARITVPSLRGQDDLVGKITRGEFEEMCGDIFQKILAPVKSALTSARMTVDMVDHVLLTGGSTRIPKVQEILQAHFPGKTLHQSISPDEAIAHGAAELAQSLIHNYTGLSLVDVTPLGLGIEVFGGIMSTIIPRGSQLPAKFANPYKPVYKDQTNVAIKVYEGERPMAVDNHFLGAYTLSGVQRDFPPLQVSFEINTSGILHTEAVEVRTGRRMEMTFSDDERRSREEVREMMAELKLHEKHDEAQRANLEARYQFEKALAAVDVAALMNKGVSGLYETYQTFLRWHEVNRGRVMKQEEYLQRAGTLLTMPKKPT